MKLTLKEMLELKAAASKPNMIIADDISINKKLSLAEKIKLAQLSKTGIKTDLDTNIKVIDESRAMALESTVKPILNDNLAIIPQIPEIMPSTNTVASTSKIIQSKVSLLELIKAKKAAMSTEQIVAEAENTHKQLQKEMKIYTVEEAKEYNRENSGVMEETPYDNNLAEDKEVVSAVNRIESNTKLNALLALRERMSNTRKVVEEAVGEALANTQDNLLLDIPEVTSNVNTRGNINVVKGFTTTIPEGLLPPLPVVSEVIRSNETFSLNITLNEKQQAAVDFVAQNKCFVVLGAAGTGKTSSERAMLHKLIETDSLKTTTFKGIGEKRIDSASVAVCAYTRRAAANSAKAIHKDPVLREKFPNNIMTIHALLEFIPEVYYDVVTESEKFRFAPTRDANNKLTITTVIIEEATLVGLDLWEMLYAALPYDVQIIFVGDINQLPPVFGPSILNYAITRLPVIELTQVYRQAEGSPIIENAHRILRGDLLVEGKNAQGALTIYSGKKDIKIGQARTALAVANLFKVLYSTGDYNPEEDMILSPWNKQELGTDALNTYVAEFLSIKYNTLVYEIIAGFSKRYLAEGDKIIYNKKDAIIVSIEPNPAYVGKAARLPSVDLSRYGMMRATSKGSEESGIHILDEEGEVGDYENFNLKQLEETAMDRKMQASHKVMIAYEDGYSDTLTSASDLQFNTFSLGYAMTVHKSQGSEWRRVYCVFHPDHAMSLSREMLYTAITRAREEVFIIAKRYVVDKAVVSQRVKGNTLQDKITIFNSGIKDVLGNIKVTKPSIGEAK